MSLCPFCKTRNASPSAPCTACGRRAAEHPSLQPQGGGASLGGGWDDDEGGGLGDLELSRGEAATPAGGPGAYAGGSLAFGDDDPFADEPTGGDLELDMPARPPPAPVPDLAVPPMERRLPSQGAMPAVRPPSHGAMPAVPALQGAMPSPVEAPSTAAALSPDPEPPSAPVGPAGPRSGPGPGTPDPAQLVARYPTPPARVWEFPAYTIRVLLRQLELRQDLATLRKRRSPDVPLYERALAVHDARTFVTGLAMTCAVLAVLGFLFFLPVILRFLRSPD